MNKGMNHQTKKVNIFNQEKRKILCIANQHDYLGDGTIFHHEELQVGKQYTFVKGERMVYGLMVHLDELPCECGYQSYLFEELQPYDAKILERECNNWLKQKLDESEKAIKEGRMRSYSFEEFKQRQALRAFHETDKTVATACYGESVESTMREEGESDESCNRNAQIAGHHGVGGEDLEKIVNDFMEMDSDLLYNNFKKESPPLLDIPDDIV